MVRCRSGSISCKAPTENNMSTPIGAALSIFVRGNTMKGRTRAKEEAFIRGDGDRLQVLSKPCMAPSIQEKGRFCKLTHPESPRKRTHPERSRRMMGRANRDGRVAPHTPMRARERPGRLPRVIPYDRGPSGAPSLKQPARAPSCYRARPPPGVTPDAQSASGCPSPILSTRTSRATAKIPTHQNSSPTHVPSRAGAPDAPRRG